MSDKTMLLVDGSSYLYRAYHAMPDLRAPDGFPTGAIHGMVAMMKRLREQVPAEHAACVFDAKGRPSATTGTPSTRPSARPCPTPLRQQIEPIHEVVRLLGWPVLEVPGIEADDAIGTLARVAAASGHQVVISTGDKDLAQLVTPQVTLINTMSNERLDVAGVMAKFGVPPERIIDYLTLIGDTRGQRARRRQGGPQDGRQVDCRARLAGRRGGRGRRHQGRGRREPAQGAGLAAHGPQRWSRW
jgi:DNA polymerase-1